MITQVMADGWWRIEGKIDEAEDEDEDDNDDRHYGRKSRDEK